ncbi:MAG TPA: signal peptidase I, partial [Saprospiraceae bacterium]|nr:signal peptidase I [Saprospiraceae bacterium]
MDQTIDEQNSTVPTKPRNTWIAFFLSFFLPGLGQVYNGQIRKAAVFFTCIVLFPVFIALSGALNTFFGAILLMVGELAFKGFVILDAVVNALRQKEYVLKPYNKWYYYLLIGIVIFPALWVYDPRPMMGFQSFRIPTTSNSPTLQVGDYVMVNMKAYRKSEPDYGDIVVFKKDDGLQYLFRVVGRPNDRLELKDNIIT